MMTLILPPNCGSALKHAPPALQQKTLRLLAKWPVTKSQAPPSIPKHCVVRLKSLFIYGKENGLIPVNSPKRVSFKSVVAVTILLNFGYFICTVVNGVLTDISIIFVIVLRIFKNWLAKKMANV